MPRLARVQGPGRLPTQQEWECTARVGQPAVTAGHFDRRLPLRPWEIDERTWTFGDYGRDCYEAALKALADRPLTPEGAKVTTLLAAHVETSHAQRRTDPDQ